MGIDGCTGRALVPSGASTGKFEAVELRDGEKEFCGLGVKKAVENVNTKIAELLVGENALNQMYIDQLLAEEDGTEKDVYKRQSTASTALIAASSTPVCPTMSGLAKLMMITSYF